MTTQEMQTKVEGLELVMERVFDAPPDLVFKAHSEPEALAAWWGPRGWNLTHNEMDFRVGGTWHYCMTGPEGEESWGLSTYKEIEVPRRIVYVDQFADAEGNPNKDMPETRVTVEFLDEGGKTRLVSRAVYASKEDLQTVLEMGIEAGFAETWDRLAEYLAGQTG